MERQASLIVREYCNQICAQFNGALLSSSRQASGTQDNEMALQDNSRGLAEDPISMNTVVPAVTVTHSGDENDSILAMATNFLFTGEEYPWLLQRTISAFTMDHSNCKSMRLVQTEFLRRAQATRNVDSSFQRDATIDLNWEPWICLKEYFETDTHIGDTIVIVGGESKTYASTCRAYVTMLWPVTGPKVLDVVNQALCDRVGMQTESNESILDIEFTKGKTYAHAKGQVIQLLEATEILVWMATASRIPFSDHTISYYEPHVDRNNLNEFKLTIKLSDIAMSHHNATAPSNSCWHEMFSAVTIAHGYPIPIRSESDKSIELSVEVLTALVEASTFRHYEGRLLLKGFNSMFGVSHLGEDTGTVQWHFIVSSDPKVRILYNDGLQFPICGSAPPLQDLISEKFRYFVGWCRKARVMAGMYNDLSSRVSY